MRRCRARAVEQVLQRLAADPDVAHVEIDRRAKTQAQPSDPMYGSQWNLSDPVGGIAAPRAWDITTGDPNAPIAILDTGVLPHPDLAGRVIGGYDFVADARFSNDGDGRDADASDPGDFVTSAESTTPGSPLQGCAAGNSTWHGTMVAGTLGAAVNNGNGMSGVNWTSPLLNVRVMGKCGGALSDVADGIRWAAGLPVPGVPANSTPARVINLSLAGLGDCGPILQSAVTDAIANGAIIVAAAGNDNEDVVNHWPANCNGVIAVAATSKNGSRAFYTNSGSRIAVSAPGGGIGGSIPVLRNAGTTSPDPNGLRLRAAAGLEPGGAARLGPRIAGPGDRPQPDARRGSRADRVECAGVPRGRNRSLLDVDLRRRDCRCSTNVAAPRAERTTGTTASRPDPAATLDAARTRAAANAGYAGASPAGRCPTGRSCAGPRRMAARSRPRS